MCGINGIVYLSGEKNPLEMNDKIKSMNNTIIHRGPDSEGVYDYNNVCFGFRRLSIIDLSSDANQPMYNIDKSLVVVFNGEIYNYVELYDELIGKGYKFRTKSDTEVILNSYTEWGFECVNKFNGMWAFAIYDIRKGEIFASRDRMGVKPFYYHLNDKYIVFSSETKAIAAVENLRDANTAKVYEYLAYGYNKSGDGETFYKDISELLPGHNLFIKEGKVSIKRFWKLEPGKYSFKSTDEAYNKFKELIEDSIRIRYRSDVPIAFLLSGGVDSSVIAVMTEKLKSDGVLDQNTIEAFTVHFPGFKDDELNITERFAKECKHLHLNVITTAIPEIVNNLNKIVFDLDQPLGSFSHVIHNQMMKKIHERGVKVALNGQGSDEAFYGYDKHIFGYFLLDRLLERKGDFFKQMKAIHSYLGFSYKTIFSQLLKSLFSKKTASYTRAKYVEQSIECLNSKFTNDNKMHYKYDYNFTFKGGNLIHYAIEQISNTGLNSILHYEDVSSMNASVEMRSPFMDYRLMEFAFSIPDEMKFDKGVTKKIIRDVFATELPDYILNNPRKIGFSSPFTDYLQTEEFKNLTTQLLNSDSFKTKTIWNQEIIKERFNNLQNYPSFPFWRFINLEIWSKVNNIKGL